MASKGKGELKVISKDDRNVVEFAQAAQTHAAVADNYIIDSPEMYDIAKAQLADIHAAGKKVEEMRTSISEPLHKAWKATNALFKPITDQLETAKKTLGRKLAAFEDIERARVRAAEQAAEAQRQRDIEAAAAAEAETRAAFERGEAEAEAVEAAAAATMIAEVSTPISAVASPVSREGAARRDRWVLGEVTDMPTLLEFLAARMRKGEFDNTVEIKPGQLNAFVTSREGKVTIPGASFVRDSKLISRGA